MRSRIIKTPLTVVRNTGTELNAANRSVDTNVEIPNVLFSIQPFTSKTTQVILPEGIRSDNARVLYSNCAINTADQLNKTKADRVNIEGRDFVAYSVDNWSFHGSNADHYETVFIREDLLSQFAEGI